MTRNSVIAGCGLAMAAVLLAGLPASGSAHADTKLTTDLNALVNDPALRGAGVGLVVSKADTGEVLYSREAGARRQPASNMKLLTSATAMEILGPDHRFTTSVLTHGTIRRSTLHGDLYLRGTGDPTTLASTYDALAAKVAATGLRTVRGKLVADDTWFDAVPYGTGWAWDDEPYYYNAETSALTIAPDTDYDAGSIIVRVMPGSPGKWANVWTDPPTDYVTIENATITGAPGTANTIAAEREHGTNVIRVSGMIPSGSPHSAKFSTVRKPAGLAAAVFRDALRRHGVEVTGATKTGVATPPDAKVVTENKSMPLSQLLVPFMKLSNNMHAEVLVKSIGRAVSGAGTWNAGLAAVNQRLTGLGIPAGTTSLADGSGLSRMNQISADQVAALLRAARSKPWFTTWFDSLPIAGVADRMVGGTLRSRMQGTAAAGNVRAKTGSLSGVSALSGYVTSADGQPLVFAMISNNSRTSVRRFEDAVAVRLAEYRAGETGRPAAPRLAGETGPADRVECSWLKAC
ncbi:D-alanyl-D-alanine carboxypeptidase/D-alanyl-D-alanine endopeptidase [Kibdelosporangium phytohabitans]|uniref:D-alanyl-D-alanine carboxypeptidase n=1 Tax=Kibdelosporangium phytohabitans TaxID=860235 RepID=A0A0N9HVI2_9PSEU|nr:D-alanyl-D-alanine carboxypeptidase/D-alanyl-D-alanine-endopeptidase [Kibdelosporangium phytohabitans]ALG09118.1 D-alanyl-D-alanine carboxypeptidase [Kibdelosporangium phytohabitans]MBE1469680.1 D-alanyl-D-alanine carboxypeptidase/D-alanyl-D-alanine-endopeptidase (penicillin-binding protein 4) [Kibdelosporangium phytohabitans]